MKLDVDSADTSDMNSGSIPTPTPTAASAKPPSSTIGTGTRGSNAKGQGTYQPSQTQRLSFFGIHGDIIGQQPPNKTTMECKRGCTMLSGCYDDWRTYQLTVFKKPPQHPTLKDWIGVPEQRSNLLVRPNQCITKYDMNGQDVNQTGPELSVDQFDVFHTEKFEVTDAEVDSMVPKGTQDLCENWRGVKIEVHRGKLQPEGSKAPDSVVSQG